MYKEIEKEATNYFSENVVDLLFNTIQDNLKEHFKNGNIPKENVFGSFIVNDIELKSGDLTNVYVEYIGTLIQPLGVDTKIVKIIIFDEVPNIVLDRYNNYKKINEAINCDGFWTMDDSKLDNRTCMICGQSEKYHK